MTTQIDFRNIRADFPNGQRGAFEELMCQLAFRQSSSPGQFKRVEGSGGDGGVECIEITEAGIIGYQAKFYTEVGDINWASVDRSVQTALRLYPNLIRYVVAMPCDFTGRKDLGSGRVSEGAWGIWEKHRKEWEAEAAQKERCVEFIPWTEFSLRDQLTKPNAEGLRAYWFGEIEFSAAWFKQHAESAIASLDERYSPQDHVHVHLQDIFDVLIKHPRAITSLEERFAEFRKNSLPTFSAHNPPQELLKEARAGLTRVLDGEAELRDQSWQTWDQAKWAESILSTRQTLAELRKWCENNPGSNTYESHQLIKLQAALTSLDEAVEKTILSFGRTTSILFYGTAGTGKSHLLARVVDCSVNEERPVVLWAGQQLRDQPLWPQLLLRLGLPTTTPEQFLGALEATAQAKRTRALLLVDAINEGAGARLWRSEIVEFLAKTRGYPSIVVVLACRSEYLKYLIPKEALKKLQSVKVLGFETDEEQAAAARVYLDKRGISRPATPWLAPEFVNPLFLRSCCNALERAKLREFPRGLAGTKAIMSFYLDSVGRNLGVGRDGSDELLGPMKRSLVELARTMASERHSYTKIGRASNVISDCFRPYSPPEGLTWLDVLRRNGLLRLDPNPNLDDAKDSFEDLDVVQFTFQRFQDHLMADALLKDITDIQIAFSNDGPLSFVRKGKEFAWEWRGLVEALAIQVPERFGRELVDILPGGSREWWPVYFAQDSFLESIRWRSTSAFTDRTLDLFNQLFAVSESPFSRLIELSASIDHPWNAELIHRNLKPKPMHTRDTFWSNRLNIECSDDHHSVQRLIDWCLRPESKSADPRTVSLCSIILTWLFTLSNRPVRDRATKALANLLVEHSRLFGELLAKFDGVDDLYVWERLFEAAYGAACIDPDTRRLREYARLAAERLFLANYVPENLLLRDCGRGLIQLAEKSGVLPPDFPVERCHPPYGSPLPRFTATREQVEELAKKTADRTILHSCDTWGDFGHYEIEPAVRRFTASRLKSSPPITSEKLFNEFLREVVQPFPNRRDAWRALQQATAPEIRIIFTGSAKPDEMPQDLTQRKRERRQVATVDAEKAFQGLLSEDEQQRYLSDARAYLGLGSRKAERDHRRIKTEKAQLWVARRAYQLGHASKKFPWSRGSIYNDRSRPRIERLGKKYQWIALDELVCKLADNYWMSEYGGDTRQYQYPPDAGFFRDIDPTIILSEPSPAPAHWMVAPKIVVEPKDDDIYGWPFTKERGHELEHLTTRVDTGGSLWLTAYEHQSVDSPMEAKNDSESTRSNRREEFRFICLVVVHQKDQNEFVRSITKTHRLDIHSWDPREFTDGPYLLEAHWRPTWEIDTWEEDEWNGATVARAFPVSEYHWESHLDLSLPDGHSELLPSSWLMKKLGLRKDLQLSGKYNDCRGEMRFKYGRSGTGETIALFHKDWFTAYLERESLAPVWLYLNERNSITGDMCGAWRRTEGVAWLEGNAVRTTTWHHDHTRKP